MPQAKVDVIGISNALGRIEAYQATATKAIEVLQTQHLEVSKTLSALNAVIPRFEKDLAAVTTRMDDKEKNDRTHRMLQYALAPIYTIAHAVGIHFLGPKA